MAEAKFRYHVLAFCFITATGCGPGQPRQSATESKTEEERPGASASAFYAPRGYSKVWEDHFDVAAIDTNRWSVGTLRGPAGDLVPGAAGDHLLNEEYAGYVTADDSYIDNGALVLRNQKRPYAGTSPQGDFKYTSGWVMTMHKVSINKGYFEIRAQFPSGDKVWPAIWLIAEDLVWGPEWDIFEYFGYRKDVGYDNMGTHLATGEWPSVDWKSHWIEQYDAVFDCQAWHIYGFEWTATQAIWHIDGKEVHRLNSSDVPEGRWPDEKMYIVLNNGVRTTSPDITTTWPNYLVIDYIELYQKH